MEEDQGDQGWQTLDEKDLSGCGDRPEYTCNEDAGEKEDSDVDLPGMIIDKQGPDQASRQEAIVQPLVGCEDLCGLKQFPWKSSEDFWPLARPCKHFEPQKVEVHHCDESDQDFCGHSHDSELFFIVCDKPRIGLHHMPALRTGAEFFRSVETFKVFEKILLDVFQRKVSLVELVVTVVTEP